MMSNSTLPLGFLHSNIAGHEWPAFLYLDIALPVELLFVSPTGGGDEIDKLHYLTAVVAGTDTVLKTKF